MNAAPTNGRLDGGSLPMVLVVDDHPSVLQSIQMLLRVKGYRVLAAESGETAVEICRRHRDEISIVITDLMMPGMDGQATITTLRALSPRLQFIAISGGADAQEVAQLHKLGIAAFLRKPFSMAEILAALAAAQARQQEASGNAP